MPAIRINLPNQITLGRLVLALAFFGVLTGFDARAATGGSMLLVAAFWIFLLAALGDALDGYLARALGQVTTFGRIVDPVVDKVMICGAFVFFASPHFWDGAQNIAGVAPWMVIVILLRELLVTGIRAFAESSGEPYAAVWIGKLKMIVQSTAVCVILGTLGWNLLGLAWLREALLWLTMAVTAVSAVIYVQRARRFLLSSAALSAPDIPAGSDRADGAELDDPETRAAAAGRRPGTPAAESSRAGGHSAGPHAPATRSSEAPA